jgi:hypothetical protein
MATSLACGPGSPGSLNKREEQFEIFVFLYRRKTNRLKENSFKGLSHEIEMYVWYGWRKLQRDKF